MKITKSTTSAGMFNCSGYVNGHFFTGSGWSTTDALNDCFQKINWAYSQLEAFNAVNS